MVAKSILGVCADDLEEALSAALDKIDLDFEEPDQDGGVPGGFYMPDECEIMVKLVQYEAIPTLHVFTYRRAISGDDCVEIEYKARLANYSVGTEMAVYVCTSTG